MKTVLSAFLFFILILISAILPVYASAPMPAAEINYDAVDSYITAQMQKHDFKGVSLAVISGGEIVYQKGYGSSGASRPMTAQTPMYIGSVSKSFTAVAIAQLYELGKLAFSDPVQKHLPWFEVDDPQASSQITISHLLHHTSGLSEAGFPVRLSETASIEEGVRALRTAKLTAPVGTTFQYFNNGYDILACIIEKVSGLSYAEYVQQFIFTPLEMTHTTTDVAAARSWGLSQGYSRFYGFSIPRRQPHRLFEIPAGYIISSVEDMAHYTIALMNQGAYGNTRILKPETTALLFIPIQGYGMGWFVETGHIYHGGANETFRTYVDMYPKKGIGFVLLINQGYLLDHYTSMEQMASGVRLLVQGFNPPSISNAVSPRLIGLGGLLLVLILLVVHTRNFLALRDWQTRAARWSPSRRWVDIAISFLIPMGITAIILWQLQGFFGYRFNIVLQTTYIFTALPDIGLLILLGTLPDIAQGFIKLYLYFKAGFARTGRSTAG